MAMIPAPHTYYSNSSKRAKSITERARKVEFRGETPNLSYHGFIEVMSGKDDIMEVHIERSHLKKYVKNAKYHTESVYASISREDWQYLISASTET